MNERNEKTFPQEENTIQVINFEEERKKKAKIVLDEMKKSIRPVSHQRNRKIPEIGKVNHLNMKNVNIKK